MMRLGIAGLLAGLVFAGCAQRPCFEQVAINPLQGRAIVFNACTGTYDIRIMHSPMSTTTTTTTLPRIGV